MRHDIILEILNSIHYILMVMGFYEQRLVQRLRERERACQACSCRVTEILLAHTQLNLQPIQVYILDNKVRWVYVEAQI